MHMVLWVELVFGANRVRVMLLCMCEGTIIWTSQYTIILYYETAYATKLLQGTYDNDLYLN
jgi:hypothetical protein